MTNTIDDARDLISRLEASGAGATADAQTVQNLVTSFTAAPYKADRFQARGTSWNLGSPTDLGVAQVVDLERSTAVAQITVTSEGFLIRVFPEGGLVRFGGNNLTALSATVDTRDGGAKLTSFSFYEPEPKAAQS